MVKTNAEFSACSDVVACDLDGGVALLDLESSKYYQLNETAATLWAWLADPMTIDAIVAKMTALFNIDENDCKDDVVAILTSLESAGLVEQSAL